MLTLNDAAEIIDSGKATDIGRVRSRLRLSKLNAAAMDTVRAAENAVTGQQAEEPARKKRGRPKGSKNKPKWQTAHAQSWLKGIKAAKSNRSGKAGQGAAGNAHGQEAAQGDSASAIAC